MPPRRATDTAPVSAGRGIRCLAGLILCLLCLLPARLAAQQGAVCRLPSQVDSLGGALERMSGRGPVAPGNLAYLRSVHAEISRDRVRRQLEARGMANGVPQVMALLDRADRIAASGIIEDVQGLRRTIRSVDQMVRLTCVPIGAEGGQEIPPGSGAWANTRDLPKNFVTRWIEPVIGIGLALVLVAALAGLVLLGARAHRWLMAYLYNTMACRIAAFLTAPDVSFPVPVLVTTLGRGGLRFQPDDRALFYGRLAEMPGGAVTLHLDEDRLPARLSAQFPGYAHFRFARRLSVQHQQELLQRSVISPFYIRKSRRRRLNLRKAGF